MIIINYPSKYIFNQPNLIYNFRNLNKMCAYTSVVYTNRPKGPPDSNVRPSWC